MIHLQIECPAIAEMVEFLDQICECTLARNNQLEYRKIIFAAHEAIINSIEAMKQRYGDTYQEKKITVKIKVKPDEIEVNIIDSAGGLSPELKERLKQQNYQELVWEEDGRGFLFMKHLVDEVWHDQDEDGRFIMGLRKRVETRV